MISSGATIFTPGEAVKLLSRAGGLFLAAVLAIMVIAGYRSSTGRSILDPIGTSLSRTWAWIRNNFPTLPGVAGNPWGGVAVGLAAFAAAMIFIPGTRGGKAMVATAVVCTMIGFLAYQPSLI